MKIACIAASKVPSTTANSMQVMKACQALSQLGHEVHLFVPQRPQPPDEVDLTTYYGLETRFAIHWLVSRKSLHRYDFACQAVRRARGLKADLTYVWFLQAGIFSLLARMPVMIELHGPPEGRFGPLLFRLFQSLPGKKRLLPITKALGEQLQARYHLDLRDQSLLRVSPNGVDLERYMDLPDPSTARQALSLPPTLTAGYTGHLYPGRGMALLVELARRTPQLNFLWVGGRPEDVDTWRWRLKEEAVNNVTLTGFIENNRLPLYQAAADILLMPYEKVITGSSGGDSTSYASPMKMFEYMASKRAILSSDLPVIREVLNVSNALLCPPEDVDAWTRALDNLINDEEMRSTLARQAWQDIQRFTWLERARNALAGFIT